MPLTTKDFQVLDALDQGDITTQRQIAENTGISLGQVNYVVRRLLEKGFIKLGNFRKSSSKIGYAYLLTPKGIEAKSKLAVNFVVSRLREYNDLKRRLSERLTAFESQGRKRIVFVGPGMVKDFVAAVIDENGLNLALQGHFANSGALAEMDPDTFDMVLLFDGNSTALAAASRIPPQKICSLW